MAISQVNLRLRTTDLRAGLQKLASVSPRCAAYLADKACFSIANRAHKAMPKVEAAQIQAEMDATGFARNPDDKDWRATNNEQRHLTTAERIVIASIHPNSAFNRRTGGVFFRQKPVFSAPAPGGGGRLTSRRGYKLGAQNRLRFFAWVEERARIMIAARKKSGGFYRLGAAVVRMIFSKNYAPVARPPSDAGGNVSNEVAAGSGSVSKAIGRVAGGTRANRAGGVAKASFWVSTPEPDSKGTQQGITRVLEPVWQRAVDAEAASINAYAEELYTQAIREAGFTVK